MSFIIEVCCDSFQSVVNAGKSKADRIEICSGLGLGGVTPGISFALRSRDCFKKKIHVLIRPRAGNFKYSAEEFDIICEDIKQFKSLGIDGIVAGVLKDNGEVDIKRTTELVNLAKPMTFTFSRAFDFCIDPNKAANDVIKCGANRILTSGMKKSVNDGLKNIQLLQKNFGDKIIIMPGGGLNIKNACLLTGEGIKEFHLSASVFKEYDEIINSELVNGFGYYQEEGKYGYVSADIRLINELFNELILCNSNEK